MESENKTGRLLIKQAVFIPLIYFGMIILAGIFAVDYSHTGQHASELGINESRVAVVFFKAGIIMTCFSLFVLAFGLFAVFKKRLIMTALFLIFFGITFIFGAVFPIGSPWHGLYGAGLSVMLIPFIFLYEAKNTLDSKAVRIVSVIAGLLMFLYLWSMVAGLDPVSKRGLTQRLFGCVVFGWVSFISYHLSSCFLSENRR